MCVGFPYLKRGVQVLGGHVLHLGIRANVPVAFTTGVSSGASSGGIAIASGNAAYSAGDISLVAGDTKRAEVGANVIVQAGDSEASSSAGGNIGLEAGSGETGGSIVVRGGAGLAQEGGDVVVEAGSGAGAVGSLRLMSLYTFVTLQRK